MNLDTMWQLHRRFITGVAIGLVVFLIGMAMIGNSAGQDLKRSNGLIGKHKRALNSPVYSQAQVSELRARLNEMEDRTQRLAQSVLPPLRAEYHPAPGQSATQHYIELTGRLRTDLLGWALRQNVEIDPSLGLPAQSPTQPQMISRVLSGLDVVERVCRMAVQTGADSIQDIQIASRIPKKSRTNNGSPLVLTPVTLEVVFTDSSPKTFLDAILDLGDGLGSLGLVRMELMPADKRRKQRRVVLAFAAGSLPVDPFEEDAL
jgi:hypothetical protein